ncbi:MAG: type I glyceraldehyde-3-phosphate dehydrogenase [Candidatus Omnitrophica bacterium]|nr:type I glyceraldehyde-3-phosphate dehydrogenase [Candidatus Omnitrophota bacterium]
MAVKVGINGFGRIGRNIFRAGFKNKDIEFIAINDLPVPTESLAHLLKYDSTFGILDAKIEAKEGALIVNGKEIKVLTHKDPSQIPWGTLGVDIVIESTGVFTDAEKAKAHLAGGAKKVIISAPASKEDITIVMGVNESKYDSEKHNIISNASCTTNCLAPLAKILDEKFGIVHGLMTTVHSYTNDQKILDLAHKDLRRSRSAAISIIPTSTGAAKALGLVLPNLNGKLDGFAMRVPTPNVSVVDFVCTVKTETTAQEVNAVIKHAAENELKGILEYCDKPLVSIDFKGNPASSILDSELTKVMEKTMLKVIAWYDNEWGYSNRVVDLTAYVGKKLMAGSSQKAAAVAH